MKVAMIKRLLIVRVDCWLPLFCCLAGRINLRRFGCSASRLTARAVVMRPSHPTVNVSLSHRSGAVIGRFWMCDLTTGKWTQLTNHPADDFEGKWSPDGSKLVFCSTRTGQKDIWVIDIKSGETRS